MDWMQTKNLLRALLQKTPKDLGFLKQVDLKAGQLAMESIDDDGCEDAAACATSAILDPFLEEISSESPESSDKSQETTDGPVVSDVDVDEVDDDHPSCCSKKASYSVLVNVAHVDLSSKNTLEQDILQNQRDTATQKALVAKANKLRADSAKEKDFAASAAKRRQAKEQTEKAEYSSLLHAPPGPVTGGIK